MSRIDQVKNGKKGEVACAKALGCEGECYEPMKRTLGLLVCVGGGAGT